MEWTNDLVLHFINLYETHRVLWDSSYKHYKIVNKKNDAWQVISTELNIDVVELKRKMNALLASYRKARQKIYKNNHSGMGADELYTPWFAYKSFAFLHDKYKPKPTKNTDGLATTEITVEENNEAEEDDDEGGPGGENKEVSQRETENQTTEGNAAGENTIALVEQQKKTFVSPNVQRKRLRRDEDPRIAESFGILKAVANKNKDEFDAFGEYVARALRAMDKRSTAFVKKAFSDILFDAEMGKYALPERDSTFPASSSQVNSQVIDTSYQAPRAQSQLLNVNRDYPSPSHTDNSRYSYPSPQESLSNPSSHGAGDPLLDLHSMSSSTPTLLNIVTQWNNN